MNLRWNNPIWLPLLPTSVCLADVALTLYGQPTTYWQGNYLDVIEGNPIPRFFLQFHPLAFGALVLAWIACFTLLILLVPRRWSVYACCFVAFSHAVGAASWLFHSGRSGPWLMLAFLVMVAILTISVWKTRQSDLPDHGN
jgi:hypothetical protein